MRGFHDENYDGIVLMLPDWFIKMNGLEPAIQAFEKALNGCKLSIYHPGHTRNIFELKNSADKKEMLEGEKEAARKAKEFREAKFQRLIDKEEYELGWHTDKYTCVCDYIILDGKKYHIGDMVNMRSGVKAKFKKLFAKEVVDGESFLKFAETNISGFPYHGLRSEKVTPEIFMKPFTIYENKHGEIFISGKRLHVSINYRRTEMNYKFNIVPLYFNKKEGWNLDSPNKELTGFIRKGMKLIKGQ